MCMKLSRTRAFTLVEVLIAVVIITFIIIACLASFMTAFNYLRRSMELRAATLILQEEVSLVRELKFPEIQSLGGTFSTGSMSALKDASGTILKSQYGAQAAIMKITFKIAWTAFDGKPAQKMLVTLITEHGIDKK